MEERLPGGFVTTVVRAGDTARRPPSANAAFVHTWVAAHRNELEAGLA